MLVGCRLCTWFCDQRIDLRTTNLSQTSTMCKKLLKLQMHSICGRRLVLRPLCDPYIVLILVRYIVQCTSRSANMFYDRKCVLQNLFFSFIYLPYFTNVLPYSHFTLIIKNGTKENPSISSTHHSRKEIGWNYKSNITTTQHKRPVTSVNSSKSVSQSEEEGHNLTYCHQFISGRSTEK